MKLQIYTDGSARDNGTNHSIGAWGYVIVFNGEVSGKDCGVEHGATNQQMELEACIRACEKVEPMVMPFDEIEIITDSAYVYNCATQRWYDKWEHNGWYTSARSPVANKERWQRLIPYFHKFEYNFRKTKGHATDKFNCMVDEMVQNATLKEKNKCQEQ